MQQRPNLCVLSVCLCTCGLVEIWGALWKPMWNGSETSLSQCSRIHPKPLPGPGCWRVLLTCWRLNNRDPRPIYSQAAKFPSLPSASVSLYGLARALGVVLPHSIFFSRGAALVFAWTIAVLASLRFLPRKRCGRWSCKKQAGSSFWTSPIRPIIRFSWLLSTHFHTFPYRRNEHRRNTFAGSSSTSLLVDVWQLQDRPRSLCRFSRG